MFSRAPAGSAFVKGQDDVERALELIRIACAERENAKDTPRQSQLGWL